MRLEMKVISSIPDEILIHFFFYFDTLDIISQFELLFIEQNKKIPVTRWTETSIVVYQDFFRTSEFHRERAYDFSKL